MTLRTDLEELAERGEPAGADLVFQRALADSQRIGATVKTRTSSEPSRSKMALIAAGIAAAVAVVAGVGLAFIPEGERGAVVETAGAADRSDQIPREETPKLPEGKTLVGSNELGEVGWIADPNNPELDSEGIPVPVPIYNDASQQIAWWGYGIGWIDLETMSDPAYDFRAEYREYFSYVDKSSFAESIPGATG